MLANYEVLDRWNFAWVHGKRHPPPVNIIAVSGLSGPAYIVGCFGQHLASAQQLFAVKKPTPLGLQLSCYLRIHNTIHPSEGARYLGWGFTRRAGSQPLFSHRVPRWTTPITTRCLTAPPQKSFADRKDEPPVICASV
jgi:hypothetical protein